MMFYYFALNEVEDVVNSKVKHFEEEAKLVNLWIIPDIYDFSGVWFSRLRKVGRRAKEDESMVMMRTKSCHEHWHGGKKWI